jgi:hypothetical protein
MTPRLQPGDTVADEHGAVGQITFDIVEGGKLLSAARFANNYAAFAQPVEIEGVERPGSIMMKLVLTMLIERVPTASIRLFEPSGEGPIFTADKAAEYPQAPQGRL